MVIVYIMQVIGHYTGVVLENIWFIPARGVGALKFLAEPPAPRKIGGRRNVGGASQNFLKSPRR